MAIDLRCPGCGTRLAPDAPDGLCPRCLVQQGLDLLNPQGSAQTVSVPAASLSHPRPRVHPHSRFGDYELIEVIAQGGMGVVYHARQLSLNRMVALKMILSGQLASPAEVARFRTEAEAAAKLDHPNIVPIYEIGEHQGQHYFSMKLVEGGCLSEAIGGQPMPVRQAGRLLAILARAVHFAHQHGILHRDLKPTNILLDREGVPQLTDFGLAKLLENDSTLTKSLAVIGSASYMSPEQAAGRTKDLTTAVDVYGLGAVLYEMLTGRPPFQGEGFLETLRCVIDREPIRPSALNAKVDPDLETICLKCLEKMPQHRYASAEALALELERWLAGEPILARPSSTWERTVKWARRKPAIAALAALLVMATTAGLAGVLWQWQQAEGARRFAERKATDELQERQKAQTAADALRRNLYAADMNLASRALADNNFGRAAALIAKYYPSSEQTELRGFEWRYLWKLTRGDEQFTFWHDHFVEAVAFSPDGRVLATTGHELNVRLWDLTTHQPFATLSGFPAILERGELFFSPDGRFLIAASRGANLTRVWETVGWQEVALLRHAALPVFFLDQGTIIGARTRNGLSFWNTVTWEPVPMTGETFPEMGRHLATSANGRFVVAALEDDQTEHIQVFDLEGRTLVNQFPRPVDPFRANWAISGDGQWLAMGDWRGQLRFWDVARGREVASLTAHASPIYGVSFSADNRTLATAGFDQLIHLWDRVQPRRVATLQGHFNEIWSVVFSPDGRLLASASKDRTAKIWNATPKPEDLLLTNTIYPVAFVAGGSNLLALRADRSLGTWDVHTRREISDPDGISHIVVRGGVDVAQDGSMVALGYDSGLVEVWYKNHPEAVRAIQAHSGVVGSVSLSPDGHWVATASEGSAKLFDLQTGRLLFQFPDTRRSVLISPDGKKLVGASGPNTAKLWDLATRREIALLEGHKWLLWSCVFSPDSQRLATTSMEGVVRLWSTVTGQPLGMLSGHKEGVTAAAFSPDGRTLATGSTDDLVKFWSTDTHQELLSWGFGEDVGSILFSPDGLSVAVGCFPGTGGTKPIQILRAPSLADIDVQWRQEQDSTSRSARATGQ